MKSGAAITKPADETCLKFQAELPAYLEGESVAGITSHAAECEYCRCLLADMRNIVQASSVLSLEAPPDSLWVSVRAALIEEKIIRPPAVTRPAPAASGRRWFPWTGGGVLRYPVPIAAGVIIACVLLFKAPGYLTPSPMQSTNTLHPAAFMQTDIPPQDMAKLRQTIGVLEQAYQANQASMEPSTRAAYEQSLASLNNEIEECRASAEEQPGDGLAQSYLSKAYVEKAKVLQTALEYNLH